MEDDSWTRGNIVVATPQQNSDHRATIGPNEKKNPLLGYLDLIGVAGWQNLAAFRREQKWQGKFSSSAYLQFSRQMRCFCV